MNILNINKLYTIERFQVFLPDINDLPYVFDFKYC